MRFEYSDTTDGAVITAVYGNSEEITIPDTIDGKPVRELAAYALSGKNISTDSELDTEFRLAGDNITHVTLPDTLRRIGELCFYQCRRLKSISFPDTMIELGSDAFMNCKGLDTVYIRGSVKAPSPLRRILLLRTDATDAWFDDAAIHFSEYSERYDLIGPAHIFELNIEGEGFRTRKCFNGDVFDIDLYDTVFAKAKDTEDEKTLCRIAALRLSRPTGLSDDKKDIYQGYLLEHMEVYLNDAIEKRDITLIERLCSENILSKEALELTLTLMIKNRWTDGVAKLLNSNGGLS